MDEQLTRYAAGRADHVQLLDSLSTAQWQRQAHHGEHGWMTIADYEVHVAAEDVDHLAQIARLLAQLPKK